MASLCIAYAHQLWVIRHDDKAKHGTCRQSRKILVNFRDSGEAEVVMSIAFKLKYTAISIDCGMPEVIKEARRNLWMKYKNLKSTNNRGTKVQIVHPAKLLLNSQTDLNTKYVNIQSACRNSTE